MKNAETTGLSFLAIIRASVLIAWRANPRLFSASIFLAIFTGITPIGLIYLNSSLAAVLVKGLTEVPTPEITGEVRMILAQILALSVVLFLGGRLSLRAQRLHTLEVGNYVQLEIGRKCAGLDLQHFEQPEFLNLMQNAASEANSRPVSMVQNLVQACTAVTGLVSLAAPLALWHPWLLGAISIPPLIDLYFESQLGRENFLFQTARTETERKKRYFFSILNSDRYAKEVRLFRLQDFVIGRAGALRDVLFKGDVRMANRRLAKGATAGLLGPLGQFGIIWFTVMELLAHRISFLQFSFFSQAGITFQGRLSALGQSIAQLSESRLFISRYFAFLSLQPAVELPRNDAGESGITRFPCIEFRNVSFSYPGTERQVLRDISFVINPGEVVALVGPNGSGKSTLVKLLAGLYRPTAGGVFLDGKNLDQVNLEEVRRCFAFVFQDYNIYDFSVRENVGIGQADEAATPAKVEQAARRAGLHEVVAKLKFGYETVLGRLFTDGHQLSGGQRQLVALARAMFRQAPVLVLDEPTAALDSQNERTFFANVIQERQFAQQSVIFISHRQTAVRHASRILLLDGGRLAADASHEKLLAENPLYAEMYVVHSKS